MRTCRLCGRTIDIGEQMWLDWQGVCHMACSPPAVPTPGTHEALGRELGAMVDKKAASYGGSAGVDSLQRTADYLRLLFPNGIKPEQYLTVGYLVRDFDKSARIASDANAFDEDPFADKAGYALRMMAIRREQQEKKKDTKQPC